MRDVEYSKGANYGEHPRKLTPCAPIALLHTAGIKISSRYLRPHASTRHSSGYSSLGSRTVAQGTFPITPPTCVMMMYQWLCYLEKGYRRNVQYALPLFARAHVCNPPALMSAPDSSKSPGALVPAKHRAAHELQIEYAHRPGLYKEDRVPCGKAVQEIMDGKQMRASTATSFGTIAALPGAS